MNRPIPTSIHGVLDYITAPTLFALPRVFKWGKKTTALLTGAAAGILGYSMVTRYELGLIKLLPMKGHLALDMVGGATLAAAPFVLLDEDERTPDKIGVLIGLGVYEIAAALLTQPQSPLELVSEEGTIPDTVDELIVAEVQA